MISLIWLIASFLALLTLRFLFTGFLLAASRLLTESDKLGKAVYTILFFPGIIIHELSHFFMASTLGVHTGEITIFPEELNGDTKLGSVKIAKSDPFRLALIGSAPLIIGSMVLYALLRVQFPFVFTLDPLEAALRFLEKIQEWQDLLFMYLLFTISNTMVLSKSDRQGLIPVFIFIVGILMISYTIALNETRKILAFNVVTNIFSSLALSFTLVMVVNLIFLLPLITLVKGLEKLKKKKVHLKLGFS